MFFKRTRDARKPNTQPANDASQADVTGAIAPATQPDATDAFAMPGATGATDATGAPVGVETALGLDDDPIRARINALG